jgi:phosphopantothenoylcysteine decarboxylase/phosphopantothenate--cysteine ligase
VASAREKLVAKNLDLVVANDVSSPDAGFEVATNRVVLVTRDAQDARPLMSKKAVAGEVLDRLEAMLKGATDGPA